MKKLFWWTKFSIEVYWKVIRTRKYFEIFGFGDNVKKDFLKETIEVWQSLNKNTKSESATLKGRFN